jgi:hypothetical protein
MNIFIVPVMIKPRLCDNCNARPTSSGYNFCSKICAEAYQRRINRLCIDQRQVINTRYAMNLTTCKNCTKTISDGNFCSIQCGRQYHNNRACAHCQAYPMSNIYSPYCSFDCRRAGQNQINRLFL